MLFARRFISIIVVLSFFAVQLIAQQATPATETKAPAGDEFTVLIEGLAQSLRAHVKATAARKVEASFQEAWRNADVTLKASVF